MHAGFGVAFSSVSDLVLDTVVEQLRQYPPYSVVFTGTSAVLSVDERLVLIELCSSGHSIGGALAAIAGIMLKANATGAAVRVFTFGTPRCSAEH